MSRFLDADKVLVFKLYDDLTEEFYEKEFTIQNFIDTYAVDGCPQPVEAEPIRHGHWIDNGKYWYVCSVCDYVEPLSTLMDAHYKYCPNCGAKMDASGEQ